jgi:hypothetical protein
VELEGVRELVALGFRVVEREKADGGDSRAPSSIEAMKRPMGAFWTMECWGGVRSGQSGAATVPADTSRARPAGVDRG